MKEISTDLLVDLARLLHRYPPEVWRHVSNLLEDRKSREQIIEFFQGMARLGEEARSVPRPAPFGSHYERTRELGVLRAELSRMTLPQLRQLAVSFRVPVPPKVSKKELASRIYREIAFMQSGDIQPSTLPIRDAGPAGEDYKKWVRVIMGRHARK